MTVVIGGAVIGALAGYLFFTERGRALRRQIEPALDEFASELSRFRGGVQRALTVATEGWDSNDDHPRSPEGFGREPQTH